MSKKHLGSVSNETNKKSDIEQYASESALYGLLCAKWVPSKCIQNFIRNLENGDCFFDNYFCVISDFYIFAAVNDSESVSMKRMI